MIDTAARTKAFAVWFKDLERWSVDYFRHVEWLWPVDVIRQIGEVLRYKRVDIDAGLDRDQVPIIGKISFSGVVFITSSENRKNYKGRLFWAESGDFVYSKIRVKQGSLAVIPPEIGRLAVSAEYPVYSIDENQADGKYLELVIRSRFFLRLIEGISHGGSTKTRIPPDEFEKLTIPIPPLSVQRAIVAHWEQAQAEIVELRRRIDELETQIEMEFLSALGLTMPSQTILPKAFGLWWKDLLPRWGVDVNKQSLDFLDPATGIYPTYSLGEVITDLENGLSPLSLNRPAAEGEWGVLKMGAVSFGVFDERQNKAIPSNIITPQPRLEVKPGDWLISRANITRLVGACALVRNTRPSLML